MAVAADVQTGRVTALLVINSGSGPVLCPFFAMCDGVLLIDEAGISTEFHQHNVWDARSLCDLILALHPRGLVCGFIGDAEKQRLQRARIDVRLGSCSCSINELVVEFDNLPRP